HQPKTANRGIQSSLPTAFHRHRTTHQRWPSISAYKLSQTPSPISFVFRFHTQFLKLPLSLSPLYYDPTNRNLMKIRKTKFWPSIVFIAFSVYLTHETLQSAEKRWFCANFTSILAP